MTSLPLTGTYKFSVDAYLTDFRGKMTLPMIGNFMLQAATKHADERGFGYSDMKSIQRIWVLSRMAIELREYPDNNSILTVNTWVADVSRLFTERYFSFENEQGKEIGFAKSLWAAIDWETRKPSSMLELTELLKLIDKDKPCPIENMSKIPLLKEDYDIVDNFKVKYSDIDINKHLNSMKYIEHLVNVFDINLFKEKEIRRIEINYLSEGKYGSHLTILQKKEEDFTYLLEMKDGETTVCSSCVQWQ